MEANLSSPLEVGTREENHEVLSQGTPWSYRAVIYLSRFDGRPAVIKDYNDLYLPLKLLIAWRLIRREVRAYRKLAGFDGIPELLGQVNRYSLALKHIPGRPLSRFRPGELPVEFFDQLAQQVQEMHRRGVVHGDIRRNNILVVHPYQPVIIDFNCSLTQDSRYRPLKSWFYRFFRDLDHKGVLKLKEAFLPGTLTLEEKENLKSEAHLYRWGKLLRHKVYRPIKRRFRERRLICSAARTFWKKGFASEPYSVISSLVLYMFIKGYPWEKILQGAEIFCRDRRGPFQDQQELESFVHRFYAMRQNGSSSLQELELFCGIFRKQYLCRAQEADCRWRQEMAVSLNRRRDGDSVDEDC